MKLGELAERLRAIGGAGVPLRVFDDELERLRLRCLVAVHGDPLRSLGLCLYFAGAVAEAQSRRVAVPTPILREHLEAFANGERYYVERVRFARHGVHLAPFELDRLLSAR